MRTRLFGPLLLLLLLLLLAFFPMLGNIRATKAAKIEMNQPMAPFFLENENTKAVLVYFGYVGCTTICIPTLNEFTPVYRHLYRRFPSLSFYFVNLNPTQPSEWAGVFAKSFDPNFHGIYANLDQVNRLERDFNLAISPSDGDLSHSSNLYLMIRGNNGYSLKRIYTTHPYSENEIMNDLENLY